MRNLELASYSVQLMKAQAIDLCKVQPMRCLSSSCSHMVGQQALRQMKIETMSTGGAQSMEPSRPSTSTSSSQLILTGLMRTSMGETTAICTFQSTVRPTNALFTSHSTDVEGQLKAWATRSTTDWVR